MTNGLYLRFGTRIDQGVNLRVHALAERLLSSPLTGISEIIPGIVTLYLEYDARTLPYQRLRGWLDSHLEQVDSAGRAPGRLIEIPVRYDGCDLEEVARQTDLSEADVVERHAAPTYTVLLVGFSPGQPYLGMVAEGLRVPRRASPRPQVPAASVVVANALTTIGPFAQPTGWLVLGRALSRIYDPHWAEPALLKPGDRVRFVPSNGEVPTMPEPRALLPVMPRTPLFRVIEPGLLDLLVDGGRNMAERFGLPRSGPLDSRSARQANGLVGNRRDAPLLEINVKGPVLEALRGGVAAFAGWGLSPQVNRTPLEPFRSFAFKRGDVISFRPLAGGVRGYLAVPEGFESDRYLGSASVSLRGRIGRPLAGGDLLGVALVRSARSGFGFLPPRGWSDGVVTLRIVPGPQASEEALTRLVGASFAVSSADRIGVRLQGPALPGGEVISEAVPVGAVQVPPGGAPILLLNDRGTTGGYAKPALVHPADLPLAGQLRPGTRVRFVLRRERICRTIDLC